MRCATNASLLCLRGAQGVVVVAVSALVPAAGACSSSPAYQCTGPTSFQVFEANLPSSAVPLCTDETDAEVAPQTFDSGAGAFFGGTTGAPFPGASTLSAEGLAQCAALCAGASSAVPCCQSQWEPSTILCVPACQ